MKTSDLEPLRIVRPDTLMEVFQDGRRKRMPVPFGGAVPTETTPMSFGINVRPTGSIPTVLGKGAIDFQTGKCNSSVYCASGDFSFVAGGYGNSAPGMYAFAAGAYSFAAGTNSAAFCGGTVSGKNSLAVRGRVDSDSSFNVGNNNIEVGVDNSAAFGSGGTLQYKPYQFTTGISTRGYLYNERKHGAYIFSYGRALLFGSTFNVQDRELFLNQSNTERLSLAQQPVAGPRACRIWVHAWKSDYTQVFFAKRIIVVAVVAGTLTALMPVATEGTDFTTSGAGTIGINVTVDTATKSLKLIASAGAGAVGIWNWRVCVESLEG